MKLKGLLSLLMIIVLSFTVYGGSGKNSKSERLFKIPPKITCVNDLPECLREQVQNNENVIQLFPDEAPVASKKADISIETENDGSNQLALMEAQTAYTFHVVTGSFRVKPNAEILVKQLRKIGYADTHIDYSDSEGLYRVIVREYDNEEKAENYLQKFSEKNPNILKTWILQKEKLEPVYYSENL